jgi:GPH family glycoside/pentoside/hexuronide:cation symporter
MEMSVEKRLPGLLVGSYGFASFAFTLMMSLAVQYYAMFLTDVAMIAAGHVAFIMFITHIVDVVSIPVSGSIIQRTQFRWGQFRTWILFPPVITCIFFTLTFTNLTLSYGAKIVYLSLVYIIAHISLNFAYNAHLGLISVLAKESKERLRLSTRNYQFRMGSQIIYAYFVLTILYKLSSYSTTWGYFITVAILAVIQVFGYWFLGYQVKNYDRYNPDKNLDPSRHWTNLEMVKQIIVNRPLLTILCADICINIGVYSLQTLAVYYFKYAAQNELLMKPYSLSISLAVFASALISPKIVSILGKKNTYLFAGACGTIGYITLRVFGLYHPYAFIAIIVVSILGAGTVYPIRQAMYMDAAEYGFYKTGMDASAFIMSMMTMPGKAATAIAGTMATAGLGYIGYVPNIEPGEEFLQGLMNIICYIPSGAGLVAFLIILLLYPLNNDRIALIMETNAKKRAAI